MKSAHGVAKFESIANQVADLVLEFGGALSGEHGDGLVRSPFQEKMFGPVLYGAFREIKRTFDPDGVLNPGKIVDSPPLTDNLKFGAQYLTRDVETQFDFSDYGGLSRAAEQCGGIGECRKSLTGTMCPSYMVTRDEAHSTRGRANLLRMAISGQLGKEGFTDPALHSALDLCLECKACKSECPTSVDMPRMKSEFLYQYHHRHGAPRRDRLLSAAEQFAKWGSRLAPVSNWITQGTLGRWLCERAFGLDRRRIPPAFARQTFVNWWRRHGARAIDRNGGEPAVAIFVDTFTNYYEPRHAIAVARIATRLNRNVIAAPRVCCGRPLISKGFLREATARAEASVRSLAPLAARGIPIVFCEPSCHSAVCDDHPHLLRGELKALALQVAEASTLAAQWIDASLAAAGNTDLSSLFAPGPERVLLHGHCHEKALVGTAATVRMLSRIPHCQVSEVDSGCCGMAGSFGYEKEHFEISWAIGERKLLPAVRQRPPGTVVVAAGFSCRHQIGHFTGIEALSPVELMASLLFDADQ
jgi:Fe-S oxidoreductase